MQMEAVYKIIQDAISIIANSISTNRPDIKIDSGLYIVTNFKRKPENSTNKIKYLFELHPEQKGSYIVRIDQIKLGCFHNNTESITIDFDSKNQDMNYVYEKIKKAYNELKDLE